VQWVAPPRAGRICGCNARVGAIDPPAEQPLPRLHAPPIRAIESGGGPMDISKIAIGREPPFDVNAVIEIPQGGEPVKYELDKDSGAMFVDRFLHTAMFYPGNYGFIPHTLSEDGDPVDVLVVGQVPVVPGAVIRCRPIGALLMTDEKGADEKVVAVPVDALHPFYSGIRSHEDLPRILREQIAHFFQHYKDLEKGKWVSVAQWVGPDEAGRMITEAIQRARK
jgi:inorganic pyrophosphatase